MNISDFNFIGIGNLSISMHNISTDVALQPFMVSQSEDKIYEAIALNFGILASGETEKEAIENLAIAILNYTMSYIRLNQPIKFLEPDDKLRDFNAEYLRLSVIQKRQDVTNYIKSITEDVSTSTNYYRVA